MLKAAAAIVSSVGREMAEALTFPKEAILVFGL
jgi:hypothetical protein